MWALLEAHKRKADGEGLTGEDKGKATYILPGGGALKLWVKKHQSLERRATIATLVNMAEVLSIAEGRNRKFKIVLSQKLVRLPDGPGQRHVVAYLWDGSVEGAVGGIDDMGGMSREGTY